jgi:aminoglycoside/choline kinase family phosphotransferase
MDAPPEKGEDVRPFVSVAQFLARAGCAAPQVHKADAEQGFLLLEDFGDAIFARVLETDPSMEPTLYRAAADVLVQLAKAPPPPLAAYDSVTMTKMSALAFDWYQLGATGQTNQSERETFTKVMADALAPLDKVSRVVVQRDYHAENLIWLPDRNGVKRVGLLDFQDAMLGHPAYDLVSILQDARRDLLPGTEHSILNYYCETAGIDAATFTAAYNLLGIQRNLRILGVFARLSMAYGKPLYVDFIPRVWGHLTRTLDDPALQDLRDSLLPALPEPDPTILDRLKDLCGTHPIR